MDHEDMYLQKILADFLSFDYQIVLYALLTNILYWNHIVSVRYWEDIKTSFHQLLGQTTRWLLRIILAPMIHKN